MVLKRQKKYTAQEIADRTYNIDLCGYPHEEEEILPPKELIQQYQEKRASLNADIDRIFAQITDILGIDLEEVEADTKQLERRKDLYGDIRC